MSDEHLANYLCIGCPLGCRLEVEDDDTGNVVEVRGHACKRGDTYGRQEHVDPRRMVTTSVRVIGGVWAKLPVKTTDSVPKSMVNDVCKAVQNVALPAPIKIGTVVLTNVLGTGADIVATRDIDQA